MNFFKKIKNIITNQKGFGLIEILASLAIIGIGISGNLYIQKKIFREAAAIKADSAAITLFNETYFNLKKSEVCNSILQGETVPQYTQSDDGVIRLNGKLEEIYNNNTKIIAIGDDVGENKALKVSDIFLRNQDGIAYFVVEFERDLNKSQGIKKIQRKFPLNLIRSSSGVVETCYDTLKNVKKTVTRRACNGNDGMEYDEENDECKPRMLPVHAGCIPTNDDTQSDGGFIHSIRVANGLYKFDCRQKGLIANTQCNFGERAIGFNENGILCRKIDAPDLKPLFIGNCDSNDACKVQAQLQDDSDSFGLSCSKLSDPIDCQTASILTREFLVPIAINQTEATIAGVPAPYDKCECTGTNIKRCPSEFTASIQTQPNECGVKCDDSNLSPAPGSKSYNWRDVNLPGPATCTQERVLVDTNCGSCNSITQTKTCTYDYQYTVTQAQGECGNCTVNPDETESAVVACNCGNEGDTCCGGNTCNSLALQADTSTPVCTCTPVDPCPGGTVGIGEACGMGCACSSGTCVNNICTECGDQGELCCNTGLTCNGVLSCVNGTCDQCGLSGQPPCPSSGCQAPLTLNPISNTCTECPASTGQYCDNACPCTSSTETCQMDPVQGFNVCSDCGDQGEACCPSPTGPICDNPSLSCDPLSNTCQSCGVLGSICSATCPCSDGSLCSPIGQCISCGSQGENCCSGSTCDSGLTCDATSTCTQCGTLGNFCDASCPCSTPGQDCVGNLCVQPSLINDCTMGCTTNSECVSGSCDITSGMCTPVSGQICDCGSAYPDFDSNCVTCQWEAPSGDPCKSAVTDTVEVSHECVCGGVISDASNCIGSAPSVIHDCNAAPTGCQNAQLGEACSADSDCCSDTCISVGNGSPNMICSDPSTPTCTPQGSICSASDPTCCGNTICIDHDNDGSTTCEPPVSCSSSTCSGGETCCSGLTCNSSGLCVEPGNCCSSSEDCCFDNSGGSGSTSAAQCVSSGSCSQSVLPGSQCGLNCPTPTTVTTTSTTCPIPPTCNTSCDPSACPSGLCVSTGSACGEVCQECETCSVPPTCNTSCDPSACPSGSCVSTGSFACGLPCQECATCNIPPTCNTSCDPSTCPSGACMGVGMECGEVCEACTPTTTIPTTTLCTVSPLCKTEFQCNKSCAGASCTSEGGESCGQDCYICPNNPPPPPPTVPTCTPSASCKADCPANEASMCPGPPQCSPILNYECGEQCYTCIVPIPNNNTGFGAPGHCQTCFGIYSCATGLYCNNGICEEVGGELCNPPPPIEPCEPCSNNPGTAPCWPGYFCDGNKCQKDGYYPGGPVTAC